MSTRLRKLFGILAVAACLAVSALTSGPANAADWPGDIGPKRELAQSKTVDMASAGPQAIASETARLNA